MVKNESTEMFNDVKIPVGTNGAFMGAEDREVSEFANFTQKMISLYLSRFSWDQIKVLVPEIKDQNEENIKLIVKMIHDVSTRKFRKNFIISLAGNVPRSLNFVEMSEAIKVVGQPNGRAKKINPAAIVDSIIYDMQNVELIAPAVKTPTARTSLSPEYIEGRIAVLGERRVRTEKRIKNLNKRTEKLNKILSTDSENVEAKYKMGKVLRSIENVKSAVADIDAKIEVFQRKLSELPKTEPEAVEEIVDENQ